MNNQRVDQYGNRALKQHYIPTGPNGHLQNPLAKNNRKNILLKHTRTILQDTTHVGQQNKSYLTKKDGNYLKYLFLLQ